MVSKQDRQRAAKMTRDLAIHQRRSILQARRHGNEVVTGVLSAFRSGKRKLRVKGMMKRSRELLRDSMLVSFLQGEKTESQLLDLSLSVHSKAIDAMANRSRLTAQQLASLADKYNALAIHVIEEATVSVEAALQKAMIKITQEGQHVREGMATLRSTLAAQGITPESSWQLEAIYRTQTQLAFSAGRWHTDQDPDIQDVLWGYKYVTVGDDRVRDEHLSMEGMQAPKDHVIWSTHFPPNGWVCRCQAIPITRKRKTVVYTDVEPDKGFAYNPGVVLAPK